MMHLQFETPEEYKAEMGISGLNLPEAESDDSEGSDVRIPPPFMEVPGSRKKIVTSNSAAQPAHESGFRGMETPAQRLAQQQAADAVMRQLLGKRCRKCCRAIKWSNVQRH